MHSSAYGPKADIYIFFLSRTNKWKPVTEVLSYVVVATFMLMFVCFWHDSLQWARES
jgi:hypothetical protein